MSESTSSSNLKRELGTLEAYALLIGILVGAGIFKVTSEATAATGPSVLLAHIVLAFVVLTTAVAYLVFLSTSLGTKPGGEVLHIGSTLGGARLTFLAAWLKTISYLGAGAYLADALALNLLELIRPGEAHPSWIRAAIALTAVAVLGAVHLRGVRHFGRLQVWMCSLLFLALLVLLVPGFFAIRVDNYEPFFTDGFGGFTAALPPLFFAYAGFEALAQAGGEVENSTERLPRIFVRGICVTTLIFVSMSAVAFGVLPASELSASGVPMSHAAATYLPFGAEAMVTLGAVMAIATSLNASLFVPARLAWILAREGTMPAAFGTLHPRWGTPIIGLLVSFAMIALLLLTGRMDLALGISVVALMLLYLLHSVALLLLPRRRPELFAESRCRLPRGVQVGCAWISILALGAIVAVQLGGDVQRILGASLGARWSALDLTSLELLCLWIAIGLLLFRSPRVARSSA